MRRRIPPSTRPRDGHGFTLIELMTVVVILGVLAAVAIGAYSRQVRNAHKTEVMADLSNLTLRQKNFMAVTGHYASSTKSETVTFPTMTKVTGAKQPLVWSSDHATQGAGGLGDAGYTAVGQTGQFFRGGDVVHGFDALRFLPENGSSWCGYGTISGYGSTYVEGNPPDNTKADLPPFASTIAGETFPTANAEEQRYYARDWFYSVAMCDFDHDGKFWAFSTAHYQSGINADDSKDGTYEKGE
jgi:prepilin-type N-terminal cleavage/methylation domain-containing protein